MKINQINGAVAAPNTQNTSAAERTEETHSASSTRTPESSATWQSSMPRTAADSSQDIDTTRVTQISNAIKNGDFKIDVAKIADGLIEETHRYLNQE